MIGLIRAAALCVTLALGLVTAQAADKAFKRDDLPDSAIKLEAQIKTEAGAVTKPAADAARPTPTPPSAATISAPGCSARPDCGRAPGFRQLAADRAHRLPGPPADSREQTFLLERASTAAYLAYQRATTPAEEADALVVLGRAFAERKVWRPALDTLAAVARPARGRRGPRAI